ncbi:MAG TPA: hypothetical protein VGC55_02225, partial [Dokdonella sp.]
MLSFYQDRIANEGYLRTSTERRSLIELGRLTGYALRPGVSASVYLAYDLDASAGTVVIPPGTRAQSVPGAGEKMQTFETAETLEARAAWSRIAARTSEPPWRSRTDDDSGYGVLSKGLLFKGTATQLKVNDALLVDYADGGTPVPYRVTDLLVDNDAQTTRALLAGWNAAAPAPPKPAPLPALTAAQLVAQIERPLSLQPRDATRVPRTAAATLVRGGEIYPRLLAQRSSALRDMLVPALRSFSVAGSASGSIKAYALRSKAALLGSAAPKRVVTGLGDGANPVFDDLRLNVAWADLPEVAQLSGRHLPPSIDLQHLPLDGSFEAVKPGSATAPSYVLVDFTATGIDKLTTSVVSVNAHQTVAMSIGAAMSARVSSLTTNEVWLEVPRDALGDAPDLDYVPLLRRTQVFAQSELLDLARDPLAAEVDGSGGELELDAYYDGLKPGMWVIAAGERADIADPTVSVPAAERAMIAAVRHDVVRLPDTLTGQSAEALPGDTLHTFVTL